MLSHAANPLAMPLAKDIFRVFYSGRDAKNRSSVGAFDYDMKSAQVIEDHEEPFFCSGLSGSYYENGVSIGNCYSVGIKTYMLFMAWPNPENAHWYGDIGRLIVNDDMTLSLDQDTPFISCRDFNSISLSYPWVQPSDLKGFEMWYGTTETWDAGNDEMLHVIKSAASSDGQIWEQTDKVIPFAIGTAQAFSRPTILKNPDGTQDMWFSYRSGSGTPYRIGHSRFSDGVWSQTPGDPGIDVSRSGWDSEMIEYPFVFKYEDKIFMLYNGNGYGETGIGLAELQR
ncbi:hypothetical protein [Sneathiella litorea]|uniref:hypothetical protein n=1 Tax=Sneathiella litorea TaxID=2606216 RepID=UPI001929517B|nr:hypothetical protein [Sneathiella litorea]